MAGRNEDNYRLVSDECALKDALSELKRNLKHGTFLAVDCEGVSLSRKGALTIITVATEEMVFIFDVLKLGEAVFTGGLDVILQDKSREKLMFDCRQDSDALWYQFNVKLDGVLDLQLLEVIYRRENSAASSNLKTSKNKRRSQRTDEIEKIYGFRRCIELYVQDDDLVKTKEKGSKLFKNDEDAWKSRPLSDDLIKYCVADAVGMFRLFDKMKDVHKRQQARLRVASERYVDLFRRRAQRSFDDYEGNAYLPLDIIPDEGTLSFAYANTTCTRCHRLFPREEFSVTQLRKGEQKCRVCKEIKRQADEAQNRINNWNRAEESDDDDFCYVSDEDFFW